MSLILSDQVEDSERQVLLVSGPVHDGLGQLVGDRAQEARLTTREDQE